MTKRTSSGDKLGRYRQPPSKREIAARGANVPTPRSTLQARYVRVLLTCWSCKHQREADLQGLIDAGRGDVPLVELCWRCARCGHRRIDAVVVAKDVGPNRAREA